MVKMTLDIPKEINRRIKIIAALEGLNLTEEVVKMLGDSVWIDESADGSFADAVSAYLENEEEDEEGEDEGEED